MYEEKKTFDVLKGTIPDFRPIYKEKLLNGTDPVLKENLIPVEINESNGEVTKADIRETWYKYEEHKWANAVILKEGATELEVGAEIQESDIESYFVWIPKYKYKIFDMEKYTTSGVVKDKSQKAIEIKFGTDNTTDDGEIDGESTCKTPMINEVQGASGSDGKCQKDYWMTHPAFLAFDATGFWVGKFETGYAGANSVTDAQAHNNATEANKIVIKPNQYSWRNISLGNAFRTSLNYETNLQSHLMKNTEWGAVAYLTHSIYGKCESSDNCTEIMINNSQNCITGMSAKNKPTTGYPAYKDYKTSTPKTNNDISWTYTDKNSVLASTSGNYSGIYDMSGGVWEETASFMYQSGNSNINYSKSGMNDNDLTDKKYYDVYNYSVLITEYNKRILGDATGELGPFGVVIKGQDIMSSMFADYANFLSNNSYLSGACFTRGGDSVNGTDAGVFAFDEYPGVNGDLVGFRVVLAPTEEKS